MKHSFLSIKIFILFFSLFFLILNFSFAQDYYRPNTKRLKIYYNGKVRLSSIQEYDKKGNLLFSKSMEFQNALKYGDINYSFHEYNKLGVEIKSLYWEVGENKITIFIQQEISKNTYKWSSYNIDNKNKNWGSYIKQMGDIEQNRNLFKQVLQEIFDNEKSTTLSFTLCSYNKKGKALKETTLNDKDTLLKTLYQYNKKGQKTYFSHNDKTLGSWEYFYSYKKGKIMSSTRMSLEHKSQILTKDTTEHTVYQYDKAGNLIEENIKLYDLTYKTQYKYDKNNKLIEELNFSDGELLSKKKYDYDFQSFTIEYIDLKNGSPATKEIFVYEYY